MKQYIYLLSLLLVSLAHGAHRPFSQESRITRNDAFFSMIKHCVRFTDKEGAKAAQTFVDKHADVLLEENIWESPALLAVTEMDKQDNPGCKAMSEILRAFVIKTHGERIAK